MSKIIVNKNKVTQFKLLLEDIKDKLNMESKKQYAGLYYNGRIEITEFYGEVFRINQSNYKTKSFRFTKVKDEHHQDLYEAWYEVFDESIQFQII